MVWVMETRTRLSISQELPQHERNEIIKNIMVSYNIYFFIYLIKNKRQICIFINSLQSRVEDREMEVKDVLENYTNLEKECESAKQPVSIELQVCKNIFIAQFLIDCY